MAPSKPSSNKGASKGKGKPTSDDADRPSSGGDLKIANSLKLRHILCEKQTKSLEALVKIKAGTSFDAVATAYSEDKARHGGSLGSVLRGGKHAARAIERLASAVQGEELTTVG